jgi:enoyl-CoA hydratase
MTGQPTTATRLVSVEHVDNVAIVEIDHPPVNALNATVIAELADAFDRIEADPGIAAVLVRGGGSRAFVAGADITEFVGLELDAASTFAETVQRLTDHIAACSKPVLAAIQGFCLGGGLELALACDIRVASENALLGLPEVKLGLLPGGGGTQRLHRVVGQGRSRLLTLLGEPISAATAYEWGLVEKVVPADELQAVAIELARTFSDRSAYALAEIKALLNGTADGPMAEGLSLEAKGFARCIVSEDGREGVTAFLEKRAAAWPTRRP